MHYYLWLSRLVLGEESFPFWQPGEYVRALSRLLGSTGLREKSVCAGTYRKDLHLKEKDMLPKFNQKLGFTNYNENLPRSVLSA